MVVIGVGLLGAWLLFGGDQAGPGDQVGASVLAETDTVRKRNQHSSARSGRSTDSRPAGEAGEKSEEVDTAEVADDEGVAGGSRVVVRVHPSWCVPSSPGRPLPRVQAWPVGVGLDEARTWEVNLESCSTSVPAERIEQVQAQGLCLYRHGARPACELVLSRGAEPTFDVPRLSDEVVLVGCPGEPGVEEGPVVESVFGQAPLEEMCLGFCVPVEWLVATDRGCSAVQTTALYLNELPLAWDLMSLGAR